MSSYYSTVNRQLLAKLPLTAGRILEVGCGAGSLAREYKTLNPTATYLGIELFETAAADARAHLDQVIVGDIERDETLAALDTALAGSPVDVLVFGDVLEHLRDPWAVLAKLRARVAPGGLCLACIPNVAHWSVLAGQLQGQWDYADSGLLDRTHLRFFTLDSAKAMFEGAGWVMADAGSRMIQREETEAAVEAFVPAAQKLGLDGAVMRRNLSTYQWVIRALNDAAPPPPLRVTAVSMDRAIGMAAVRIEEPLAALAAQPGVTTRSSPLNLTVSKTDPPGLLVLQRQLFHTPAFLEAVNTVAARGWVVVSDIDDDPRQRAGFVANDFLAFKASHAITVSTEPMAALMRRWNPNVAILPNAVGALTAAPPATPKQGARLRVFFGATNRAHDWSPLRDALNGAIEALADRIEMVVVHDRAFHYALPDGVTRTFHDTLPYDQYKAVLATCDIALLPLADTEFNHHKSDLKLIECCAAGVVPICSPVVYADDPRNADVAVFADGATAFAEALTALCHDLPRLAALRARGLAYVAAERMQAQQVAPREALYRRLMADQSALEAQRQQRLAAIRAAGGPRFGP